MYKNNLPNVKTYYQYIKTKLLINLLPNYFVNPKYLNFESLSKNFSGNDSFPAFEGLGKLNKMQMVIPFWGCNTKLAHLK